MYCYSFFLLLFTSCSGGDGGGGGDSAHDQVVSPAPADNAIGAAITTDLSWTIASGATSYDVYFGTNSTAVLNADTGSGEFMGNQAATSYDPPGDLTANTTYYWRIDSVNATGTTTGVVWSFKSALTNHRLFVSGTMGVMIWDDSDLIVADAAADATLGSLTDPVTRITLSGDRLFVTQDNAATPLYIFDNASSLADASLASDSVPVAGFAGTPLGGMVNDMFVDSSDRLWICNEAIRLFLNAGSLTSSSTSQAQFTHPWDQVTGMASILPETSSWEAREAVME